ncbi:MAG TPA: hypothetical protein VNK52_07190 [Hyphomicrobiaceae bacterium]|nr:hypothetical protein [Hyphomicrobiaceae bacterium]
MTLDDAARWRALAAEARSIAVEMSDAEARRIMLWIARRYEVLAQYAEARATTPAKK